MPAEQANHRRTRDERHVDTVDHVEHSGAARREADPRLPHDSSVAISRMHRCLLVADHHHLHARAIRIVHDRLDMSTEQAEHRVNPLVL